MSSGNMWETMCRFDGEGANEVVRAGVLRQSRTAADRLGHRHPGEDVRDLVFDIELVAIPQNG